MSNGNSNDPWAFGIVRDGQRIAVEYTLECAKHWVDAEIVPLVPMQQRDDLLEALVNVRNCPRATENHFRDATKMVSETTAPAIVFYPSGSLGEEVSP